ncbi:MAG TPA: ABC transporter substrate-binding protein [Bacilli bacterium]
MFKWKNHMIAFVVTVCMIFALTACGTAKTDNSGKETAQPEKKEPVTLTILSHYVGKNEDFLKPYIDEWNKENPDIQVKLEGVKFGELLPTIMAKQTSGQGADINHIYSLWAGQLAKSGVLADAPQDVVDDVTNNYSPAAVKGATVNGKIFGYPTEVESFGLYYNKRILQEAGFDHPPTTWDEMLSMAKAINKKDANGKMVTEGIGLQKGWPAIIEQPFLALMETAGGSFMSDDLTKLNLDSDAAKKVMDLYAQIYGKNGISDYGFDPEKAFEAGQLGMTINAGYWAGSLKVIMKDKYSEVGTAPLPSPDGNTKGSLAYTYAWSVNKKSKHQAEAWKFLKWFNSQAYKDGVTPQGSFLLDAFDVLSTRKSDVQAQPLQDKLKSDPLLKVFEDAMEYAKPEPNPVAGAEIQTEFAKTIESVWTNQLTPDQALQKAQADLQAKLK